MRFAAIAAVIGSFVFLVIVWIALPWVSGDTPFVMDGSNAFLTCLSHHDYSGCGYTGTLNYWGLMTSVGDWPLLQHVPDFISIGLGADGHAARQRILELLSVAGVVAAVVAAWVVLSRAGQRAWFWAFMLVLLSSPLLWYARTTAGEALATGLLVCLLRRSFCPRIRLSWVSPRSAPCGRRRLPTPSLWRWERSGSCSRRGARASASGLSSSPVWLVWP